MSKTNSRQSIRQWLLLPLLLAAVALIGAACGSDDDTADDAADDTPDTTVAAAASGSDDDMADDDMSDDMSDDDMSDDMSDDDMSDMMAPTGFKVGLVTDTGKVDDKSFNQSAWEGVNEASLDFGFEADYIETEEAKDYEDNINLFLDDGYNVIVTVGFGLAEATLAAADANPDVLFIGVDQFQGEVRPNVAGLIFPEDQSGFLAGALAGLLTETNIVGAVLGTDLVPPVVAFKEGWENGARYTNPEVETISTYHPGGLDTAFGDPEWGATTARQALDQGADVIFGAGGSTGNGALTEIASEPGALCVGVDTDQWYTVPEAQPCLLTSAMKLITPGVMELIGSAIDDNFPGGNYVGIVGLAPFHDHENLVTEDMRATITEISDGFMAGTMSTGYTPGG